MGETLYGFCKTPLWDYNLTWNNSTPDFTPCFHNTVMVWATCGFLWLFLPFEVLRIVNNTRNQSRWNYINVGKLIINLMISAAFCGEMFLAIFYHNPLAEIFAHAVKLITIIAVIFTSLWARNHGVRVSLFLPLFWIFLTLTSALTLRSVFLRSLEKAYPELPYLKSAITFLLSLQVILSLFADPPSHIIDISDTCPVKAKPLFGRLLYSWLFRILLKGIKDQIHEKDLPSMCPEMKSHTVMNVYEKAVGSKLSSRKNRMRVLNVEDDCVQLVSNADETLILTKRRSLLSLLFVICRKYVLISGALELSNVIVIFVPPLFIGLLLNFIQTHELQWHGYLYAFGFCFFNFMSGVFDSQNNYHITVAAVQVKSTLTNALYHKVFMLSNGAKKKHSTGEIMNLMSVDVEEIFGFVDFLHLTWSIPLKVCLIMYFLWQNLGSSCIITLGIFCILSLITSFVGGKVDKLQDMKMERKDERLKIMSEILNGIRVLKLYAWEIPFMKRVLDVRNTELKYLKRLVYWDSTFSFLWTVAPFLVTLACFALYVLVDKTHVLDAQKMFVSFALFNLLRFPMGALPDLITRFIRARVSFARVKEYLNSEEIDFSSIGTLPIEGNSITCTNGSFSWDQDVELVLKNISLKIKEGSLVAVIGPVGSGKSSLLSAFLGELYKIDGDVNIKGSIAYVPQQAWIENKTLCQNILFTKDMNSDEYQKVLEACALNPDLDILPGRDMTEIGEKGINLSGGQKQRVSLARAVYQDADIYFLDDPLSAVDANVASQLFENVIGPTGILKDKTRILVTHSISFLSSMDMIVVMNNGAIIDQGSYQELVVKNGKFSEFVQKHCTRTMDDEVKESELSLEQSTGKEIILTAESTRLIEEEYREVGKVRWKVYADYISKVGVCTFAFCVAISLLFNGCEVGGGVWLSEWSEDKTNPDGSQDIAKRNLRLGIYALLVLGQGISIIAQNITMFTGSVKASRKIHEVLLYSILRSPISFFDTTPIGRILNRFSKDMESVDFDVPNNINMSLVNILWLPSTIIIVCLTSPYFLIIIAALAVLYYILQRLYIMTSRQLRRLTSTTQSSVYSSFSESISGVSCIRAFNAQSYFIEASYERVNINLNSYFTEMTSDRWLEIYLNVIGACITLSITFLSVSQREILGPGLVGLALTYVIEVTEGFGWMTKLYSHLETSLVAVERVKEYSELKPEAQWETSLPLTNWPTDGLIEFRNYSTAYRDGLSPVLSDISIKINHGEKVGIVGRTGAGKSSLVLSLFRIIEPTAGHIYIDGTDISKIGLHDLRSRLTVIPQDPVIFAGTLRMNLDPWNEHKDEEIWQALELAHLKEYISSLAEGLDYELSESGNNLSAGQRQLVCLTRALLQKNKILVLDEATASVDLNTDRLIQTTIHNAFNDCTVIIIAHRLHTILDTDRILVLSNGRIEEDGKPKDLLQNPLSHFYKMAEDAGLT